MSCLSLEGESCRRSGQLAPRVVTNDRMAPGLDLCSAFCSEKSVRLRVVYHHAHLSKLHRAMLSDTLSIFQEQKRDGDEQQRYKPKQ